MLNKLIVAQATKTPIEQIDVMIWPGVLLWIGACIGLELESILGCVAGVARWGMSVPLRHRRQSIHAVWLGCRYGPNTLSIAGYSLAMAVNLGEHAFFFLVAFLVAPRAVV